MDPSPIPSRPCPDPRYDWAAYWTVRIEETAGLGVNVDYINMSARTRGSGPAVFSLQWTADDIVRAARTNHVAAGGRLVIPMGVYYWFSTGQQDLNLVLSVQTTDDHGHVLSTHLENHIVG